MKKLIAVLMALTILFSFAMADTQTDLQPAPAPAAEPAAEPAAANTQPAAEPAAANTQPAANVQPAAPAATEEEVQVVNFRELYDEEALAAGSFTQLGELPLQIWVPGDKFTAKEIPEDSEDYADAVLVLGWNANPDYEIIVNYGETDMSFEDYVAELKKEEEQGVITGIAVAKVNGFDAVSYMQENEDGTQYWLADYFTENGVVEFIFPAIEDEEEFSGFAEMIGCSLEAVEE